MWLLWLLTLVSADHQCSHSNLSVGDFNVTSEKQFRWLLKSEAPFLLGLSAEWCSSCCPYEELYELMHSRIKEAGLSITFVRVDVKASDYIRKYVGSVEDIPKLYFVHNEVLYPYTEEANGYIMYLFVERMFKPVQLLDSEEAFKTYWEDKRKVRRVIGVIYDTDRDQDSDYAQFMRISYQLASTGAFEVGMVVDHKLIKQLKSKHLVHFYDTILVKKPSGQTRILDLGGKALDTDTYFWVLLNSLELVDELTVNSLPIYHKIGLPMLLLFIDPYSETVDEYMEQALKVAENHWGSVAICWVDGTTEVNKEKRKVLGLMTDTIPAAAFNLHDSRVLPFDESAPFTYENLNTFVSDYRENRLTPRQRAREHTNSYYDLESMLKHIPVVTLPTFEETALTEGQDVAVFFYTSNDALYKFAKSMALTIAKMGHRMEELEMNGVKLYRYDMETDPLPRGILFNSIPALYVFPSFHKSQPYSYYVGTNHYLTMMFFLAKEVDNPLRLPKLSEMTPEEHQIYQATKDTLAQSLVKRIEADAQVRDAEWL